MNVIHNKEIGTKQKALAINLDPKIYGSFAEIGAGQEVSRWFLRVGAASGRLVTRRGWDAGSKGWSGVAA